MWNGGTTIFGNIHILKYDDIYCRLFCCFECVVLLVFSARFYLTFVRFARLPRRIVQSPNKLSTEKAHQKRKNDMSCLWEDKWSPLIVAREPIILSLMSWREARESVILELSHNHSQCVAISLFFLFFTRSNFAAFASLQLSSSGAEYIYGRSRTGESLGSWVEWRRNDVKWDVKSMKITWNETQYSKKLQIPQGRRAFFDGSILYIIYYILYIIYYILYIIYYILYIIYIYT